MLGILKQYVNDYKENKRYQKTLEQMSQRSSGKNKHPLYYRVGVDESNIPVYRRHNDQCSVSKQYFDIISQFLDMYAERRKQAGIPLIPTLWLPGCGLDAWSNGSAIERVQKEYNAEYGDKISEIRKKMVEEIPEFGILPEDLSKIYLEYAKERV